MKQLFTNNAISILAGDLNVGDSFIQVQAGLGDLYPTPAAGEFFTVTVELIAAPFTREIITITQRSGDQLFIGRRGAEGTTELDWAANTAIVDHRLTAGGIRSLQQLYDQPFITIAAGGKTQVTLESPYSPGTVRLYVGGLRQKLNVDFIERSATQLELQFELTPDDILAGTNLVVDYVAA